MILLVIGGSRTSAHSLTSEVCTGSISHNLVGEEFRILRMLSSDTGLKEDSVLYCLFVFFTIKVCLCIIANVLSAITNDFKLAIAFPVGFIPRV